MSARDNLAESERRRLLPHDREQWRYWATYRFPWQTDDSARFYFQEEADCVDFAQTWLALGCAVNTGEVHS